MIYEIRVPLLMLRLCEKYHTFLNADTHRATVRHWFIHMIDRFYLLNYNGKKI